MSQLSLDLDAPASPVRSLRTEAVRMGGRIIFHAESSLIEASRFALKFSFHGRSFLVRGTYHTTRSSYLTDDQVSRVVDFISVESIQAYRNGTYSFAHLLKSEEVQLTEAVTRTLKDPYANPYLTLVHERATAY